MQESKYLNTNAQARKKDEKIKTGAARSKNNYSWPRCKVAEICKSDEFEDVLSTKLCSCEH